MKPEYKNLKLIIETPTQEAWDAVLSIFPKNNQGNELGTSSGFYMDWQTHNKKSYLRIIDGIAQNTGAIPTPIYDITHTHLTFEEFKKQYLNMEQYKLERGTLAPWVVIDTKYNNATIAEFAEESDANTFLEIKNAVQENTDPKKITVEHVYKDVKPCFWINAAGTIGNSMFEGERGQFTRLPTEQQAKQVRAFQQLLTCAWWANGGVMPVPDNKSIFYRPFYSTISDFFKRESNGNVIEFPFYLTEEGYEKFMAIEGIEPILHAFLNTGK